MLRFKTGTLVAIFGVTLAAATGGAVWATNVRNTLDDVMRRLGRIEEAIGNDRAEQRRNAGTSFGSIGERK